MGTPQKMFQGRRQRAFLFFVPLRETAPSSCRSGVSARRSGVSTRRSGVSGRRFVSVPLQGNTCTLAGKQLYPYRETLVPLQGNTDTLAQRNFKSACSNGHSVRGDGGAALGNSGTADRNNATWSRKIEKCDWDERFNARFLKLSQIDTFNLFLCAQIIHPQT